MFWWQDVRAGQAALQQRVKLCSSGDHAGASGRVSGSRGQRQESQQHQDMEGGTHQPTTACKIKNTSEIKNLDLIWSNVVQFMISGLLVISSSPFCLLFVFLYNQLFGTKCIWIPAIDIYSSVSLYIIVVEKVSIRCLPNGSVIR